jgi:RimJ/RimL family protein N-acetyltransferase
VTQQVKIIKFEPHHLLLLDVQEEQKYFLDKFEEASEILEYGEILKGEAAWSKENTTCSWSALAGESIVGCGGIVSVSDHVGEAWTLLGKDFRKHARRIIPEIKRQIDITTKIRIYALVDEGFSRAERFIKWAGLEHEGTMKKSGIDQQDQKIYAIVKD